MSIVALERVTFVGLGPGKEQLLDDLHRFGVLEIIPLGAGSNAAAGGGPSSQAREALKFLLACPQRQRQASDHGRFSAAAVEQGALELQARIRTLEAERDDVLLRLQAARPYGNFSYSSPDHMGDWRLWFYSVPHKDLPKFEAAIGSAAEDADVAWEIAARDQRLDYVVVVSRHEPQNVPAPRARVGSRSPAEGKCRLEELELALEDAQAERAHLTRWCLLVARSLTRLKDAA
ncbi:MAG: ATPase V, partial [Pirellulaceae bacterium]|nr:ATPase V [Pirellulaceae bacterium]